MIRRAFVKASSIGAIAAPFSLPHRLFADQRNQSAFVGIQISPPTILDEGVEKCLDILQESAKVNTLLCYSQTYHGGYRPPHVMADHGFGVRDMAKRNLPYLWARSNPSFYKSTILRHQEVSKTHEYGDRDVFNELYKPLERRGVKLQARILEAGARRKDRIGNYDQVLTQDIYGAPGRGPCWNHPDYREWVYLTIQELLIRYPFLSGIQYGAERTGPLSHVLDRGDLPTCFCAHCVSRAKKKGIDHNAAKLGFTELYNWIKRIESGDPIAANAAMTGVYRIYQRYPEVLAWNFEWFQADNEIHQGIYDRVKSINPSFAVGRHVDHQRSSWDLLYRSAVSYGDMTTSADYIKPILYHDIFGLRLYHWVLERRQKRLQSNLSLEDALASFYADFGYDAVQMPTLSELRDKGMGPAYVEHETQRCVREVGGKAKVYAGIGVDVAWHLPEGGMRAHPSPPQRTKAAVKAALDVGADGILISREYNEMRLESLREIGKVL
ncbi:MAG: hypothetical protein HKN87_10400 [Saprospiraceae bacterium]|nr:hypothetical protein [Saprospiraceae bacterium]